MLNFLFVLPFFGAIKSQSYPPKLTEDEEKHYLSLMQNGDRSARTKLIEHNLRLVAHIAKKYDNTFEEKDDILSIGIIGLIKAVDTYNFDAYNKLATYAARCIENEILMHLRSNKNKHNYVYLESPIGYDKEGNEIELIDFIDDKTPNALDRLIKENEISDLNLALKTLTSRELEIISLRYGLKDNDPKTQKYIAKALNISRSYVSRIEKRALMKLYYAIINK